MKNKFGKPFAKKSLGQNFLIDQNYIGKIISALNPQPNDTIIEIGPGRGALTEHLVESGSNIVAIELDRNLVPLLQKEFAIYTNFRVFEEDALQIDFSKLRITNSESQKFKLVANLPYYISTAILQRLIEQRELFSKFVLMLQREVVDRITAPIGNSERGFLTVLVEAYCEAEKLFDVPPTAFRPTPKVWSSVVKLEVKKTQIIHNEKAFRELLSIGFSQKRKTILNNLKAKFPNAVEALEYSKIGSIRRAETLTLDEWISLASQLK
ncbi:MAG TPA: 16S rRNA (adenine(1518)-N(6)/adenine(1519)-N(6))-dimethyltransferase RsmA [Pyrinomonadaceae bacterium]|nr:16S rRNA (adenine(1518)-N(6)/adenine(1519)-N(6))-dimethyltransferase RsmA [Pyrinomonadaceae bacterium]